MAEAPGSEGGERRTGRHAADPADLPPRSPVKLLLGIVLMLFGGVLALLGVGLMVTSDDLLRQVTTGTSFPGTTEGAVLVGFAVLGLACLGTGWRLVVRR